MFIYMHCFYLFRAIFLFVSSKTIHAIWRMHLQHIQGATYSTEVQAFILSCVQGCILRQSHTQQRLPRTLKRINRFAEPRS